MMKQKEGTIQLTRQPGFTLVEVLLAVSIFAVVVSIIYSSYTGVLHAINVSMPRADAYRKADIAMMRIMEDLQSVYVRQPLEPGQPAEGAFQFVGQDVELGGKPADRLQFVSNAHVRFSETEPESGKAFITYSVRENRDQADFVLYRSDRAEFAEPAQSESPGYILCDQLAGVDFTYFDQSGEPLDEWKTGDEEGVRIPQMVTVRLELLDDAVPQGRHFFITSVILPAGSRL